MRPTSFVLICLPSSMSIVIRAPSSVSSTLATRPIGKPRRRTGVSGATPGASLTSIFTWYLPLNGNDDEKSLFRIISVLLMIIVEKTTRPTRNCLVRSFIFWGCRLSAVGYRPEGLVNDDSPLANSRQLIAVSLPLRLFTQFHHAIARF